MEHGNSVTTKSMGSEREDHNVKVVNIEMRKGYPCGSSSARLARWGRGDDEGGGASFHTVPGIQSSSSTPPPEHPHAPT